MSALGALVVSLALEHAQFTKGLDKSSQEALKFAKNTQDSFDKASKATKDYFQGGVKDVVAMGAAYLSVSSIISNLKSSIDDLGALDDMAQKTGSAVENLSRMQKVATQFGGDFDAVNGMLIKLSKGMAGIDDASSKTAKALDALGISQEFVKSHDPSEVMVEIAKRLQNYEDGAAKVALVTDAMGKTAADNLPYLNDLAENVDKFTGVSAEATAKAAALQDKLGGLKVHFNELITTVTIGMLPSMDAFITKLNTILQFKSIFSSVGGIDAKDYDKEISLREEKLKSAISMKAGLEKPTLANKINDVVFGDIADLERGITVYKDEIKALKDLKIAKDALAASPYKSPNDDKKKLDYKGAEAEAAIQAKLDAARKASAAILKQQEDQYQAVIEKVTQYTAAQSMDASQTEKVTPGQKIALEILVQVRDGKLKLNEAQKAVLATDLEAMLLQEKSTTAENLRIESQKKFTEGLVEARQAVDAMIETQQSALDKTTEQIQLMLIGKKGVDDLAIARLEETAAAYEQNIAYAKLNGVSQENITYLEQQAEAFRVLADIKKKSSEADANLDSLNLGKKRADDAIAESKRMADQIIQDQKYMGKSINSSLTDALLRGFESGSSFAENFFNTLRNMAKTLVLQPTISFLVSPISGAITAALGGLLGSGTAQASAPSLGSASGSSTGGFMSSASNLFSMIQNGNASIYSGIESVGASIANGLGGIRDTIGGFMGANASGIANALSYGGAILQLAQGNWAGAAGTAIGTALGGPIGGAIGSFLGSAVGGLFGGGDKSPRLVTTAKGNFANGTFSNGAIANQYDGGNGSASSQQALQETFAKSFGALLSGFDLSDSIKTNSMLYKKRGTGASFGASFDGGSVNTVEWSKSGDLNAIFKRMTDKVLGPLLVTAISKSKIPDGIKDLFVGLTNKTQVSNMINASVSLSRAQEKLASSFGLTINQAGKVSTATGLVGDALASFVAGLASASGANSPTSVLMDARKNLLSLFDNDLPDTLKAFDERIKGIDKSTPTGISKVAELLSGRAGFEQYTSAIDTLKGGVKGSTLGLRSQAQQQLLLQADLAKMFGALNMKVPNSIDELVALGDSIDYTTESGLNLASAFPSLVSAFQTTQQQVDSLATSLDSLNPKNFKSLVDLTRAQMYVKNGISLSKIPGYASGGDFSGGLRIVGENGPELEATGASRIISSGELMKNLRNPQANSDALIAEIRNLRSEVAQLRAESQAGNVAIANNTGKAARVLDKMDNQGVVLSETNNSGIRTVIDTRTVP